MEAQQPSKRTRRTAAEMAEARAKEAERQAEQASASGTVSTKPKKQFQRVYAKQQELDHDLYKLEVAHLRRNASYNDDAPVWEQIEHCHFFHSIDTRGR